MQISYNTSSGKKHIKMYEVVILFPPKKAPLNKDLKCASYGGKKYDIQPCKYCNN